jgi:hypothetical protein
MAQVTYVVFADSENSSVVAVISNVIDENFIDVCLSSVS